MGYLVDSSSHYILGSAFGTPRNGCVPNAVSSASEAPCEAPTLETLPRYRPARGRLGAPRASSVRVFNAASLARPAAVDSISGGYWSQLNSPLKTKQTQFRTTHRESIVCGGFVAQISILRSAAFCLCGARILACRVAIRGDIESHSGARSQRAASRFLATSEAVSEPTQRRSNGGNEMTKQSQCLITTIKYSNLRCESTATGSSVRDQAVPILCVTALSPRAAWLGALFDTGA